MKNFEYKIEKQDPLKEKTENLIPENELEISFIRSSGKGGQNVNKLATKAQLRWNIDKSQAFTPEEKEKIKFLLKNRINKEGDLIIEAQDERFQLQNKEIAIMRLNNLVQSALIPQKERIETKPTQSSQERRIEEKKKQGGKKKERNKNWRNY